MWITIKTLSNGKIDVNFSLIEAIERRESYGKIRLSKGTFYAIPLEEHDRIRKMLGVIDQHS